MEFLKGQSRRKLRFVYLLYVVNHQKLMKQRKKFCSNRILKFMEQISIYHFFFLRFFFSNPYKGYRIRTHFISDDRWPDMRGTSSEYLCTELSVLEKGQGPLARQQQNRVVKERLSSFHSLTTFFSSVGQSKKGASRLARCMNV